MFKKEMIQGKVLVTRAQGSESGFLVTQESGTSLVLGRQRQVGLQSAMASSLDKLMSSRFSKRR